MYKHEVLILCGGRGTRLKQVWEKPKILAPIGEYNYLDVMLRALAALNRNISITLATGFMSEYISQYVESRKLQLTLLNEDRELGTGGAVLNFVRQADPKRFTVINGDTLYSHDDFCRFFEASIVNPKKNVISVKKVDQNLRYGSILNSKILKIQKPKQEIENDIVFSGLITLNSADLLESNTRPLSMEYMLNESNIEYDKIIKENTE